MLRLSFCFVTECTKGDIVAYIDGDSNFSGSRRLAIRYGGDP